MSSEALTGLINNTALLLALAVLYDTFSLKPQAYTRWMQVVAGCAIGAIGLALMVSPWTLTEGLIFDTRSILLSIAGLFFGFVPAVIGALMTVTFRLTQGGVGVWVGVAVIVTSTAIGLGWRHYARNRQLRAGELYIFGLTVHAVMIMLMLILPSPIAIQTISTIGFPVLVIYPIGTVLLGLMLTRQRARKETESALRESEARLRNVIQSMPVMLNAFDENDHIIVWNSECERVLGYSAAEIVNHPDVWERLFPNADYRSKIVQQQVERSNNYANWELKMRCKDGGERTIAWSNTSDQIKIPGWAAWGIGIDVTERVQATTALRAAEERLRLALRAAHVGLWDWDLLTQEVYYSPEWKRQLGYEENELTDSIDEWQSRLHPDDAAQALAYTDAYFANPTTTFETEFRLRHRDGTYRSILVLASLLFDEGGKAVRMLGLHVDNTDRTQAAEALRTSEAHLQAVVSSTPIILLAIDQNGVITLLQGQGLNALSINPDQLIGISLFEITGGEETSLRMSLREDFLRALSGEEVNSTIVRSGLSFAVHFAALRSKTGEITGAIAVAADMTQRLEAERLRVELEKEQEIIALRERFITIASHDFRTPLTVIKMAANMLETYFDRMPAERRSVKLQQINVQVDRMTHLLNNALAVSKANAGKTEFRPEMVDLEAFCRGLWTDVTGETQQSHRLEFRYELDVKSVMLDPKLIYRALANLIGNAIKYSPSQGHVRFIVARDADLIIFRISDNGIGIAEDDVKRLFEPFFRGKNTGGIDGTGLGLSIVRSFVDVHGGRIAVESEEGKGTTFTISIPLYVV